MRNEAPRVYASILRSRLLLLGTGAVSFYFREYRGVKSFQRTVGKARPNTRQRPEEGIRPKTTFLFIRNFFETKKWIADLKNETDRQGSVVIFFNASKKI